MSGMSRVLARIGGMVESKGFLLSRYVPTAPMSVASVPRTISNTPNGEKKKLVKKQPIVSPGIASGKMRGSKTKISDMRNCIGPNDIADSATDRAKYKAAIIPALAT